MISALKLFTSSVSVSGLPALGGSPGFTVPDPGALSPLSVTLQREIFLDNFAVVWMLAAFTLAYSPRRHLWHHVAAGLCAAFAVLSKETMIIAIPALMVALWQNASRATRKYSFVGFLAAVMLVLIQYPLYAVLKGELFEGNGHVSLIGGLVYQMSRPGSGSIFAAKSGSYAVFHAWLFYDSVLIVGGVVATLVAHWLFVHDHSKRLLPAAGHGPDHRHLGGGARHLV